MGSQGVSCKCLERGQLPPVAKLQIGLGVNLPGELGMFMYVFGNVFAGKVSCLGSVPSSISSAVNAALVRRLLIRPRIEV